MRQRFILFMFLLSIVFCSSTAYTEEKDGLKTFDVDETVVTAN